MVSSVVQSSGHLRAVSGSRQCGIDPQVQQSTHLSQVSGDHAALEFWQGRVQADRRREMLLGICCGKRLRPEKIRRAQVQGVLVPGVIDCEVWGMEGA